MSRSKGAGGLAQLIERQGGERIRFFLLRTHYRSTVLFSEAAVEEAGTGLETFYRFFKRFDRITGEPFYNLDAPQARDAGETAASGDPLLQVVREKRERFLADMDDDFNTGGAIGELFDFVRILNKFCDDAKLEDPEKGRAANRETLLHGALVLRELTNILGLFSTPPQSSDDESDNGELANKLMRLLIDLRAAARKKKDFETADAIRNRLTELGITLEDRPGGTEWTT